MDALAATNVLAEAAIEVVERKTVVQDYIRHHVLYHVADGNASVWNLPFIRVPALDVFRHDEVMLAVALVRPPPIGGRDLRACSMVFCSCLLGVLVAIMGSCSEMGCGAGSIGGGVSVLRFKRCAR